MRPGVRIVMAAGIIAGGMTLAFVFPTAPDAVPAPTSAPSYVIQHRPSARRPSLSADRAPTLSTQAKRQARKPIAAVVDDESPASSGLAATSRDARPEPPVMAKSFPSITPFPKETHRGPEAVPRREPKVHRVTDGDTLESIAERYLGDASLADQVFQANRDQLEDPRLLPIGAKLTIPNVAGDPR